EWAAGAAGIDGLVPEGTPDIHADFGDYCYKGFRHSLCHGWAAGPTAWLSKHVLGVEPAEPGSTRLRIAPHLAGLEYAEGAFPTPQGVVRIRHTKASGGVETHVDAPEGVEIESGRG
ncbi:MAG: alpha-L-rhamnosidase, partial [Candidatus Hydrogenedentes bacterium]|nr:alpha-L-rhamnosidase [Candidatus Hydrogenedentota bacterium]